MATHLRAKLVMDPLEVAIGQQRPGDVIHHRDRGSQYMSVAYEAAVKFVHAEPF